MLSDVLTDSEKSILQALLDGKTRKEIQDARFVTMKTVDKHIWNIRAKLRAHGYQLVITHRVVARAIFRD